MKYRNRSFFLARMEANKTQLDIAQALKTNQTRISLFERGLKEPSPEEAAEIAALLGSTPEKIFPTREN